MIDLTALVLAAGSAVGIAAFVSTDPIIIYKSTVPQLVEYRGYSGKLIAKLLRERIRQIARTAGTARGDALGVFHDDESAIDLLAERLRLDGFIDALRELLDLHKYSLEVSVVNAESRLDLVLNEGSPRVVSAGADELKLVLKGESVDGQLFTLYTKGSNDIHVLIDKMAQRFIERVDPYVLTLYHFRKEYPGGDFTETLPMIEHSVRVLPLEEMHWPLLLWGRALYRQGNYDAAIEKYRQALKVESDFAFALARWGEALVAKGEIEAGLERMQTALQALRENQEISKARRLNTQAVIYHLLGHTLADQGRDQEAYRAYVEGLELVPENPLLQTALASLYVRHGQYLPAERLLEKAILRHPSPQIPRKLLDQVLTEMFKLQEETTPL